MQNLANQPPFVTIYICERGGVHLVIRNVNIGMSPADFFDLNNQVKNALDLFESGKWPTDNLTLTYFTTVLCLSTVDLPNLSLAMQKAAVAIECHLEKGETDKTEHTMCKTQTPQIRSAGLSPNLMDKIIPNIFVSN